MLQKITEAPPNKLRDNLEIRQDQFETILSLEAKTFDGYLFTTNNFSAWKTAFNKVRGNMRFTFKKQTDSVYKVWRYL